MGRPSSPKISSMATSPDSMDCPCSVGHAKRSVMSVHVAAATASLVYSPEKSYEYLRNIFWGFMPTVSTDDVTVRKEMLILAGYRMSTSRFSNSWPNSPE